MNLVHDEIEGLRQHEAQGASAAVPGLQRRPPSLGQRIAGWLRCLPLPLVRVFLKRRVGRLVLERAGDISLVVLPEVFNPTIFRSSLWFMEIVKQRTTGCVSSLHDTRPTPDTLPSLLDLGTGSGIGAIVGAGLGYRVVAVDINPAAVRCARINALMHDLADTIDVREGDLFAPVAGERFDLILFNPPFFRGTPKNLLDRAWRSHDVTERFAAGLPAALAPGGRALIVFSANGDLDSLVRALLDVGLYVEAVAQRDWGNEVMFVLEASLPAGGTAR